MSGRRAFTLSELMVALAFVALAVLAVVGIQIVAARGQKKSQHRLVAAQKAEAVLADIAVTLRGDLDLDVTVAKQTLPSMYNPENLPQYEYEVQQSFVGPTTDRLKEVTVSIYWSDQQGEQHFRCTSRYTE